MSRRRRRNHRLSTPLALLAGFALCLMLGHLAVALGGALCAVGIVLAALVVAWWLRAYGPPSYSRPVSRLRPRPPAARRASRDVPAAVTVTGPPPYSLFTPPPAPPGSECPACGSLPVVIHYHDDRPPAIRPRCGHEAGQPPELPRPAAKPADRPLTQISPDDPDAAEAVRRFLRGRAAGRSERIDPPAPSPEGQP